MIEVAQYDGFTKSETWQSLRLNDWANCERSQERTKLRIGPHLCSTVRERGRMKYFEWRVGVLCFMVKSDTTVRNSPDRHTAQLEYYLTEKEKLTNKHHYNSEKRLSASGSQVVSDSPVFITIRNTRENDICTTEVWVRTSASSCAADHLHNDSFNTPAVSIQFYM